MFIHRWLLASGIALAVASPVLTEEVRGVLKKIDVPNKLVVIEARGPGQRGDLMTLHLQPETRVFVLGEAASLAALLSAWAVLAGPKS